jgi:hypothetical protein
MVSKCITGDQIATEIALFKYNILKLELQAVLHYDKGNAMSHYEIQ